MKSRTLGPSKRSLVAAVFAPLIVACGTSPDADDENQSNVSSGGAGLASGGRSATVGGSTATNAGGLTGSGGSSSASGGASDVILSGGAMASGGDSFAGGNPGTGGETAIGGASSGGAADPGTGGADGESTTRSAGCGTEATLTSGEKTIDISGVTRDYVLQLPADYDPDTAYKLIFGWHWLGGEAADVVGGQITGGPYYGLEQLAEGSAIFVAPNGIDNGWANEGGRDIAFLHGMLDLFESDLCIDESRLFSTGFSYGGMMSNAIGCEISDVFRAIAPMSGALYSGCERDTEHPIGVWMAHGTGDDVVPLSDGQKALDVFLEKNGCGSETTPVSPDPCVVYSDCAEGYPVHYCEFDGGHSPPSSWGPQAIWDFFSQF